MHRILLNKHFRIAASWIAMMMCMSASVLAANCPKIKYDQLKQKLSGRGDLALVFFASWCESCIPHLKEKRSIPAIYIASFDEQSRAEKVLKALQLDPECYTSDDFAEHMGVKSLPATRRQSF